MAIWPLALPGTAAMFSAMDAVLPPAAASCCGAGIVGVHAAAWVRSVAHAAPEGLSQPCWGYRQVQQRMHAVGLPRGLGSMLPSLALVHQVWADHVVTGNRGSTSAAAALLVGA